MQSTDVTPQERMVEHPIKSREFPINQPLRVLSAKPFNIYPIANEVPTINKTFWRETEKRKDRIICGNMHVADGRTRGYPGPTKIPTATAGSQPFAVSRILETIGSVNFQSKNLWHHNCDHNDEFINRVPISSNFFQFFFSQSHWGLNELARKRGERSFVVCWKEYW